MATNKQVYLDNFIRYRNDPWAFVSECVFTLDQVDKVNPIKKFPDRDYIKLFTKIWLKYPLIAVPKSRRMTMSWTLISLYVWDTMFHKGRFNAFVSKKEEDANELIKKAKFILDNLDKDKIPRELVPKYEDKYCHLEFPELNSKLQGFPQGADQLRQFTFSGIFGDECAFWEGAQKFYSASLPTIDGGGRMSLVSSPAPGFFKRLCYDALDELGDINVAEYVPEYKSIIKGVKTWINAKNKFLVFELHYSADPKKATEAYRDSIKATMPLMEYLREYELQWDTFAGFPVYPEFNKLCITDKPFYTQVGLPLLIGMDFGLTPSAIICQFQEDMLYVFKELVEVNMGVERFCDLLIPIIRTDFKYDLSNCQVFIDPSGLFRKDTDESSCAQVLENKGFKNLNPGPVVWNKRRLAVVNYLQKLNKNGPALQIYGPSCNTLVKGFEGGYHYAEKAVEIEPNKVRPLKNEYSHVHDAFQYVCAGISDINERLRKNIPRPVYNKR